MPFYKGHTYWNHPDVKRTQFKKGQPSPRKGKKSSKPAWNKGLKGIMKPNKTSFRKGVITRERHPMWRGGITKIDKIVRRMKEYVAWRTLVFERDKYTCRDCGGENCYITAHHIYSFARIIRENNIQSISEARACEMLWDIHNGKTLCEDCHKKTDNYKGRGKVKNGANSVELSKETIPSQQRKLREVSQACVTVKSE